MEIILNILMYLGFFLLGVLTILLLLIIIKFKFSIKGENESFKIYITVFWIDILLYPRKKKQKTAKKQTKKKKTKPIKKESVFETSQNAKEKKEVIEHKEKFERELENDTETFHVEENKKGDKEVNEEIKFLDKFSIKEILHDAITLIKDLKNTLIFEKLHFFASISTEDACKTAMLYGQINAAVGMIYPCIEKSFKIVSKNVYIVPNFDKNKSETQYNVILFTRLIKIIYVLIKRRELLKYLQK